jgi:hypothetical protein
MTAVLHGLTSDFAHGRAFSEVRVPANPAVATGFTYTVGSRYWERMAGLSFVMTSDSNAANRNVLLVVKDGSGAVLDAVSPAAVQVASKAYTYVYAQYAAAINDTVNLVNTQRLPTVFLQPAYTIVVTIGSVQAGDQVSAIRVYMEQFDTGPQGYPTGMVDEDAYVNREERLGG